MVVRFIASRTTSTLRLTNNRDYDVLRHINNRYYITNDNHSVQPYDVRLFDVIEEDNTVQPVQNPQDTQPTPARRRGRPTNAEIAARQAATRPVETDAQRRAREAREAQERLEALRIAEETRRGPIRNEQDKIDTIQVTPSSLTNGVSFEISFDNRERMNDDPLEVRNRVVFNVNYSNDFSCGVHRLSGIQGFLDTIHNTLNYQEDDYELLREALFRKVGIAFQNMLDNNNVNLIRNAAFEMCSVITSNLGTVDYRQILTTYFGFTEAAPARRNPNSDNDIVVLIRRRV